MLNKNSGDPIRPPGTRVGFSPAVEVNGAYLRNSWDPQTTSRASLVMFSMSCEHVKNVAVH